MAAGTKADPMAFLQTAFELIGMAKVSSSGADAVQLGLFPKTAAISLSKPYLIARAKAEALHMAHMGYTPPTAGRPIPAVGDPGIQTFKLALYNMVQGGFISEYAKYFGILKGLSEFARVVLVAFGIQKGVEEGVEVNQDESVGFGGFISLGRSFEKLGQNLRQVCGRKSGLLGTHHLSL